MSDTSLPPWLQNAAAANEGLTKETSPELTNGWVGGAGSGLQYIRVPNLLYQLRQILLYELLQAVNVYHNRPPDLEAASG